MEFETVEKGGNTCYYKDPPEKKDEMRVKASIFDYKGINQKELFIVVEINDKKTYQIRFNSNDLTLIFSIQIERLEWDYLGEIQESGISLQMLLSLKNSQKVNYQLFYPFKNQERSELTLASWLPTIFFWEA